VSSHLGQSPGGRNDGHERLLLLLSRWTIIRECVEHGDIHLEFVGTQDQLVDILTKSLAKVRFQELRGRMGLTKLSSVKD
jgi:hypothetical protein